MIKYASLYALLLLLLVSVAGAATNETNQFERYRFDLKKGRGIPVCDAYLKRLLVSDFMAPPYCDRPENDGVQGFTKLNRIFLGEDEIFKLDRQVYGYLTRRDIHMWDKSEAQRKASGVGPVTDLKLRAEIERNHSDEGRRAEIERYLKSARPLERHFRFDPLVDVDNDGTLDQVVQWRDTGVACGSNKVNMSEQIRSPTYAFILDNEGNVDPARTREVFGHPMGNYVVHYKDHGRNISQQDERFRSVGLSMGIFVFDGKTYFDTFYDVWGDLNNHRTADPALPDTLVVLKRERGKTKAVCEIRWKEPK